MKKVKEIEKVHTNKYINKKILFIIAFLLLFLFIAILGILNKSKIIQIFENEMLGEEQTLLSYLLYDNSDNDNLKVLVTVSSDKGIEYIEKPDGTIIYTHGKSKISIDHNYTLGNEDIFKIKEIDGEIFNEKLLMIESGNEETPFTIMNAEQLLNIQNISDGILLNISKDQIYYRLGANIDLNNVEWQPIGSKTNPFVSILDGNGYTISNFKYENENEDYVGLFRYVTGTLKNMKLENAVVHGNEFVGTLAGCLEGSLIENEVNATVTGSTYAGGLVGYVESNSNLYNNTVESIVTGETCIGGLVGCVENKTNLEANIVETTVMGLTNIGGLVGYSNGNLIENKIKGKIEGTADNIGGLVGSVERGNVTGNIADVEVAGYENIGGLIGRYNITNRGLTTELNSNKSTGKVNGTNCVGGMTGYINQGVPGTIKLHSNSSTSSVTATTYAGGLIGFMSVGTAYNITTYGYVQNCYATGDVSADNTAGGLIGRLYVVGGGQGGNGYFYLENSYSAGDVSIVANDAGGLIGRCITAGYGSSASGFGKTYITNCFSTSNVIGTENVGGIIGCVDRWRSNIGYSYIYITNIYTVGNVLGESYFEPIIGCFNDQKIGRGELTVSNSYWEPETSGCSTSNYGTMTNITDMFYENQYTSWDFTDIWKIEEGSTLPYLKNLDKPESVNKENINY